MCQQASEREDANWFYKRDSYLFVVVIKETVYAVKIDVFWDGIERTVYLVLIHLHCKLEKCFPSDTVFKAFASIMFDGYTRCNAGLSQKRPCVAKLFTNSSKLSVI